MNEQQIAELAPRLRVFLKEFRGCFATDCGFEHLATYSRGLMSDLPRKSVEPIALAAGSAVRTLQKFLTFHCWDEQPVRDRLQWHLVARNMPAPGTPLDALSVNSTTWGKPFRKRQWRAFHLARQTEGPTVWKAKAGRVHLVRDGRPMRARMKGHVFARPQ